MTKKYDVVARVGSYIDSNGREKGRFENVGAVIVNQNGGFNLLLKKTFNPAGLAEPDKECVLLSLFEPQQKEQSQPPARQAPAQRPPQRQGSMKDQAPQYHSTNPQDFSDDIPY